MEVHLASRGVRVHGYDADPRLVNFWRCAPRPRAGPHGSTRVLADTAAKQHALRDLSMKEPMGLGLSVRFYAVSG